MNTFSISANTWNQGLWNSTTHEYSGTGQGITTDKISIELGNQSLTFVGNGDNKYIMVQKCIIRDGVKTFESPVNATIFRLYVRLFDKDDNVLKSFSISQGGTVDVSGALTASKIMISVDASATARSIFLDEESCTNGNYVICEPINLVYTCVHWSFASDDFPRCDDATTDIPDFTTPIPKAQWRVNPQYNDGFVYNELLPNIPYIPPPEPAQPVKQRPYICLYRYDTPQDGFDTHGMFVLTPTSCKITEELNGRYEISMEHPIDAEGRWQYIRENYIIKAMGQLFTIRTVQQIWKGSSGKIVAKGDHIFYQCGDGVIHRGSTGITGTTVASLCQQAVALTDNKDREGLLRYTFHGISNLSVTSAYRMTMVDYLEKSKTMTEFVMGNKGILEASEGEIYRDNFDYSIYSRKEGTFDNAFDIRIGKNLTGIKRTIDTTTQCTYLDAYNNYDDGISYDVPVSKMQANGIPHHIVREKSYSYTINRPWSESSKREVAWEMLKMDSKRDFDAMSAPLIAYEVDMKEVKNNPDYSEVVDLGGYTVGNGGLIYDEYLGTIDIRVTKSTTNAITGEVEQVTFGNVRSFIAQPDKQAIIDVEPEVVDIWFQVTDSEGGLCFDREGAMIIEYEGV